MLIVMMLACADWSEDTAGEVLQLNLAGYWPCDMPREYYSSEYVNRDGLTAKVRQYTAWEDGDYSFATCSFDIDGGGESIKMHSAWKIIGGGEVTMDEFGLWLIEGEDPRSIDEHGILIGEYPVVLGEPVTGGAATIESHQPCIIEGNSCVGITLHDGPFTGTATLSAGGYFEEFDLEQIPGGPWFFDGW